MGDLSLTNGSLDEAGLPALGKAAKLKRLDISSSGVTDAGMKSLAGLTNIEELTMRASPVTDEGLMHLASGSKSLKKLILANSKSITPAGLKYLAQLPSLQELDLWTCKVGGGFQALSASTSLENLTISTTGATDVDLEHLGSMKKLRRLISFDNQGITDKGVIAFL